MKKKEIDETIKRIIKKYSVNTKLNNIDSETIFSFLSQSTSLNYIDKNFYYLYIANYKIAGGRRVKMLWASDGNRKIPISKSKLLNELCPIKSKLSKDELHIGLVKSAARNIIKPQILEYREKISLPVICNLSNKKLTNWKLIHIDHIVPFSKLFSDWLDLLNISPLDILLIGPKNNKVFKDNNLRDSWYNYHKENAQLQCVDSKFNLLKSNKI